MTNGDSRFSKVNLLRFGFRALGPLFPGLGGHLAYRLFTTPRRKEVLPTDARVLAQACAFRIPFEGRELAGYRWGESGPVVLLVHGWESHAGRMRAFIRPLVARGYRVVAFDAPAHGASPGKQSNLPEWTRAVRRVIHEVGPVEAVIAHSLGAAATMLALTERPQVQVSKVVLTGPPAELSMMIGRFAGWFKLPEPVVRGMYRHIEERFGIPVEAYSLPRAVRNYHVPGLIVHDREDSVVSFSSGEAIARAWPGSRLLATNGLDHRGALQSPEVLRQIAGFLTGAPVDVPIAGVSGDAAAQSLAGQGILRGIGAWGSG
jgi:pimeloyl-ACP methyl ester carboxylesterase